MRQHTIIRKINNIYYILIKLYTEWENTCSYDSGDCGITRVLILKYKLIMANWREKKGKGNSPHSS